MRFRSVDLRVDLLLPRLKYRQALASPCTLEDSGGCAYIHYVLRNS